MKSSLLRLLLILMFFGTTFKCLRFCTGAKGLIKVKHLILLPIIGVLQIYALFRYVNKADSIRQYRDEFIIKNFKSPSKWEHDYHVHHNFRLGTYQNENGINVEDTTLVSQCSTDNLHHIEMLVKRWQGPVSIAVFAPAYDAVTALYGIDVLRRCVPDIKRFVTFHILYPTFRQPMYGEASNALLAKECEVAKAALVAADEANYARNTDIKYPQNSLRNLARVNIKTHLFYLVDIDTVPSGDLRYQFNKFAKKRGLFSTPDLLEAFITPAFELKGHLRPPEVKEEVIDLVDRNEMRPFHQDTCPHCHKPTKFDEWYASRSAQNNDLDIAYEIDYTVEVQNKNFQN